MWYRAHSHVHHGLTVFKILGKQIRHFSQLHTASDIFWPNAFDLLLKMYGLLCDFYKYILSTKMYDLHQQYKIKSE